MRHTVMASAMVVCTSGMSSEAAQTVMITINLFSDPICPWCFIGKRRLEAALAARTEIKTDIGWHTYQLNPMMPREGLSRYDYLTLKFGNKDNARRLFANIASIGEQAGISFRFDRIQTTPNTLNAHRLIRFAARHGVQGNIVERLFTAYFLDGMNIGETATLVYLAATEGIGTKETEAYLNSNEDLDVVKAEDIQARQLGIQGVPFFIMDRQYAISGAQEAEAFYPLFDLLSANSLAVA